MEGYQNSRNCARMVPGMREMDNSGASERDEKQERPGPRSPSETAATAWFSAKGGTGVPHSTTLRARSTRPNNRQVLECVRASAAFFFAPVVLSSNLAFNQAISILHSFLFFPDQTALVSDSPSPNMLIFRHISAIPNFDTGPGVRPRPPSLQIASPRTKLLSQG